MAIMNSSASAFSSYAWMRAILAHVPAASAQLEGKQGETFRLFAARRSLLPLNHLQSCTTALTPCPLPSVVRSPTIDEAQDFLNSIAVPLVLRGAPTEHPVTIALMGASGHAKILKTWQRAVLNVSGDFDTWMQHNFDHKRRKELKRLKSRLSEQGVLELEALAPGGRLAGHIAAFLDLEASGWKGRRGTAISNDPATAKGLVSGLEAMHAQGNLRFWTLRLDGKPIASLFALVDGGEAVLGKIGYDESYAKYSPGVLLIIDATQHLFDDDAIHLADANAIPGHPMIDRIWRDRLTCADMVIAGQTVSAPVFHTVAAYHGMKDAMRSQAKRIYLQITGQKQS